MEKSYSLFKWPFSFELNMETTFDVEILYIFILLVAEVGLFVAVVGLFVAEIERFVAVFTTFVAVMNKTFQNEFPIALYFQ